MVKAGWGAANLSFTFSAKIWEKRISFYIIPVYHLVNVNLAHQDFVYVFVWAFEKDFIDGHKEFVWARQCSAFENKIYYIAAGMCSTSYINAILRYSLYAFQ